MINSIKNLVVASISPILTTPQSQSDLGVPILKQAPDKSPWVLQINDFIHQDALPAVSETPISIFRLPESLHNGDPAAYLPSHVGLGPYHHFRPELGNMNLLKLGKAKNLKWGPDIPKLADQLRQLDLKNRCCFNQVLEMNAETLSWVLLIDALFLIDLLQNKYTNRPLKFPLQIFHGMLWSEVEIVSDMVKLENQIPLFVLKEICPKEPINFLAPLLYTFSSSVSPFQFPSIKFELNGFGFPSNLPEIFDLSHHLLHFIYNLILLIPDEQPALPPLASRMRMNRESRDLPPPSSSPSPSLSPPPPSEFLTESLNILGSVINIAFIQQLKDSFVLIQRVFRLVGLISKTNLLENTTPALIPSASELKTARVTFKSTKNGILNSNFDTTTLTLTLPCIHLDGFSQVLLKNLVAYEAMAEVNPPCLVNYIAVMNGLLRNSKDLKILEKAGIVSNHLNSETEAVMLFHGVENSTSSLKKGSVLKIHLQNVESESEFIKDVKRSYEIGLGVMVEKINNYYGNCWRTKMKKVASVIFKCLLILVVVFLILLVVVRFLCKHLTCPGGIFQTTIALHQIY